jgi:hypothetical protein
MMRCSILPAGADIDSVNFYFGIISGWTLASPMLVKDHRGNFLVATLVHTSLAGTHTCMDTKVLQAGSPKDSNPVHRIFQ